MSLLTGRPTSAAIRAQEPSRIMEIPGVALEEMLAALPALHRLFSQLMADRLSALNVAVEHEISQGLLGKLSMISVPDLVQTLTSSRRSGTLTLLRRGLQARLIFQDGRLRYAVYGAYKGEEAFFRTVGWAEGDFRFDPQETQGEEEARVQAETMALMMEAMRRLDEGGQNQG
jgi:CRP-like cAMP-binding protein